MLGEDSLLSFCTVITQNYLSQSLVLYESLKKHHPDLTFYCLIIDGDATDPIYDDFPFKSIFLEDLTIKNIEDMVIYYTAFELCNAVRPSLIKYLMTNYNEEKVIYLDSDIYVTSSFHEIDTHLDSCLFSFTPHITKALPLDGEQPDDLQILQVGIYNSGFWMFRKHERSLEMLDWLISRFEIYCFDDLSRRMFCDQKLLPMLVHLYKEDFLSLDEQQYNVAHWNIFQRDIIYHNNCYWIDEKPIVFFHLSGFDPANPSKLTHHLHRMTKEKLETLQPVLNHYADQLKEKKIDSIDNSYKYDIDLKTGLSLTDFRRRYYFTYRTLEGVKKEERKGIRITFKSMLKKVIKFL
jgi:lipopolysaccharide biosynthesis glycosyltransferase